MFGPGCHILCMAKGVGSLFILLFVLVGAVGIGPTTFGLKGRYLREDSIAEIG